MHPRAALAAVVRLSPFFPDGAQLELLRWLAFPRWRARADGHSEPLRIWVAGCAAGEEAYGLAMAVLAECTDDDACAEFEAVGTDSFGAAIDEARRPHWAMCRAQAIPRGYLEAFMRRGEPGCFTPCAEITSKMQFLRVAATDRVDLGVFDLIVCRHAPRGVPGAAAVPDAVERVAASLAPSGILMLGAEEARFAGRAPLREIGPRCFERTSP